MTDLEIAFAKIDEAQRQLKRHCIGLALAIVSSVSLAFFVIYPLFII